MFFKNTMIRTIANTARISTKVIKNGSVEGRYNYAQDLENKFYNQIIKLKKQHKENFGAIEKTFRKLLPNKWINVSKITAEDEFCGGGVWLGREAVKSVPEDIVGYVVKYKTNNKLEHFAGVNIDILMHEAYHLFSKFTNPKFTQRLFKVSQFESKLNEYEKFFVEHFQSPMPPPIFKMAMEDFTKFHLPKTHKIDVLQTFRYKLIDEINAYNSGKSFLEKYRQAYPNKNYSTYIDQVEFLHLKEKLEIISQILKQTLQEERNKLRLNSQ